MILQVINSLEIGGAEKYLAEITTQLIKDGEKAEILVFKRRLTPFANEVQNRGINIRYTMSESFFSPLNLITFLGLYFSKKYTVIHTHLTYAQIWVAVCSLFNFRGKLLITTEHSANNNRRGRKLMWLLDKFVYSRYHKILSIGDSVQEVLMEWLKPRNKSKYCVVTNCVNVDYFRNSKSASRQDLGILEQDTVVTMIGRMNEPKDQPTLIRAVESLNNDRYRCLLIGDGPTFDSVKASILRPYTTILTGARSDIAPLMKLTDIYVQSSHWEGMPTTVLEAMASERVVFGSNVKGVRDIVPSEQLYEEGDYSALASLITGLTLESKVEILKKQNDIINRFSLSSVVAELRKVYNGKI